jgi:hypothetical protein
VKTLILGNIANFGYVTAKNLSSCGWEVEFIDELDYIYLYSIPIWSDIYIKVHFSEIEALRQKLIQEIPVNSVYHRPTNRVEKYVYSKVLKNSALYFPFFCYESMKKKYLHNLINSLEKFDLLIVCGINALLLTTLAGQAKKTIFWPSGADFRMISIGEGRPSINNFGYLLQYQVMRQVLQKSLKKVLAIASHDPVQDYCGMFNKKMQYFPYPLPEHKPIRDKGKVFEELGLTEGDIKGKIIFFMPSRLDFYWKKNDLFLEAFVEVLEEGMLNHDLVLICSAWGKDREKALNMIGKRHKKNIIFSEHVYSLPLLYDIFFYVDVIIDQFKLGSYGTSAVGAFSCGKPVMMYIDEKVFREKKFSVPPVINCKTKEEIKAHLRNISEDSAILVKYKIETLEWFRNTHLADKAAIYLKNLLTEVGVDNGR